MGKIDGDMKTFGGMSFEDMQKRFEQIQSEWNALTPEQQEEERKKTAAYDERILAESGYFDDEEDQE